MSDVVATEEALTDATVDEVLQFMRTANPFAQHTWGWDMGRFIDWRWGSNAVRAESNPSWFGDACRIFRRNGEIEAVSVSEYGEDAVAIITASDNREIVGYVLRLLIDRHQKRGDAIGLEFSDSAEWLRQICRDAGLAEKPQSGCEWEYDLDAIDTELSLPKGFTVESLRDAPQGTLAGIGKCIQLAFDSPRNQEASLRSIETNPMFMPELSLFAAQPRRCRRRLLPRYR